MLILTIRTDNPEAEIGLYNNDQQLAYQTWRAHRQLAETLHGKIEALLQAQKKQWQDIQGIVAYEGPGSFTGLRIGLSVANALAYSLDTPVVSMGGEDWIASGISVLPEQKTGQWAMPEYGAPIHITAQKK